MHHDIAGGIVAERIQRVMVRPLVMRYEVRQRLHGFLDRLRRQVARVEIPRRNLACAVGGAVVLDEGKPRIGADVTPQIQSKGVILKRSKFSPPVGGGMGGGYYY